VSSGGLTEDAIAKLKQISDLHASGVLTDEEFAERKERSLG
jgi:Short C-terminal domain